MRLQWRAYVVLSVSACILTHLCSSRESITWAEHRFDDHRTSLNAQTNAMADTPEYEVLRSDAAWCGPRILYFFSCYYNCGDPLSDIVSRCAPDKQGHMSLFQLLQVAKDLKLAPVPVQCSFDELMKSRGPAIICLRAPSAPQSAGVHFVGLVPNQVDPESTAGFWIIDPSSRDVLAARPDNELHRMFTGFAIFLRGSKVPPLVPWYLSMNVVLSPLYCSAVLIVMVSAYRQWGPSAAAKATPTHGDKGSLST